MHTPAGYSRSQIVLHWIVAVLIALQFLLHDGMTEAWDVMTDGGTPAFDPTVVLHVVGGIAVLLFTMWRLLLRQSRGAPPPPESGPALLRTAGKLGHGALYALMILMPVSGIFAWFGLERSAAEAHELMKGLLLLLIAGHVGAAFLHHYWLKDGLLLRMKNPDA